MRKRVVQSLVAASVAAAFVMFNWSRLTSASVSDLVADAVELPQQITEAAEKVSNPGKHLGFDTYAYPGDEVMRAWRHRDVPYEWVGYYLPAPCHKGRTWMGKRERLASMGWGMAVIYVGQQTWDRVPTGYETTWRSVRRTVYVKKRVKTTALRNGKRVTRYVTRSVPVKRTVRVPVRVPVSPTKTPLDQCNTQLVSGVRGAIEADDAIRRTEAEGFPRGTVIFLDIERMQNTPARMRDYYRGWTRRVLEDGRYRPGYYVHTRNASLIYKDVKAAYTAAGRAEDPPFWVAGGRDFSPDKAPHEVGHSFAHVWQGKLDVVEVWKGFRLPLDVNVAAVPNPSHQYVALD
jgi:hypothetical protein